MFNSSLVAGLDMDITCSGHKPVQDTQDTIVVSRDEYIHSDIAKTYSIIPSFLASTGGVKYILRYWCLFVYLIASISEWNRNFIFIFLTQNFLVHVFICSFTVHKPLLSIDNLLIWLSKLRLDRRSLKCFVLCHFCHVINIIIVEVEVEVLVCWNQNSN